MIDQLTQKLLAAHFEPIKESLTEVKETLKELAEIQRYQNGKLADTRERVAVLEERSANWKAKAALPVGGGAAILMLIEMLRHVLLNPAAAEAATQTVDKVLGK